jgi:hypothetical protein
MSAIRGELIKGFVPKCNVKGPPHPRLISAPVLDEVQDEELYTCETCGAEVVERELRRDDRCVHCEVDREDL